MKHRPPVILASAVLVPLALVVVNTLFVYAPGLPGSPPRPHAGVLFWVVLVVGVGIFQALPFRSLGTRIFLTSGFAVAMFAIVFMTSLFGACSYGDCI